MMFLSKILNLFFCVLLFCFVSTINAAQQPNDTEKVPSSLVYNNPKQAIKKGLRIYENSSENPSLQVSSLVSVANAYAVLKDHEKALKYAFKAHDIAEKSDSPLDQIRTLGFISGQYQRLNIPTKALTYINKAYKITENQQLPDSLEFLKGNILFVKGLLKKNSLGCDYALNYFEKAAKILKNSIDKNSTVNANLAITLNNIGDCFLEKNETDKAKENYNKALFYSSKIEASSSVAYSKLGLGKVALQEQNYKRAVFTLNEALTLIADVEDIGKKSEIYKTLALCYKQLDDTEHYHYYNKLYLKEDRKLIENEKKSFNAVLTEISSENKIKAKNQQKYIGFLIVFGVILFLIFLVLLLRILKKRKKVNSQIEKIKNSFKRKK